MLGRETAPGKRGACGVRHTSGRARMCRHLWPPGANCRGTRGRSRHAPSASAGAVGVTSPGAGDNEGTVSGEPGAGEREAGRRGEPAWERCDMMRAAARSLCVFHARRAKAVIVGTPGCPSAGALAKKAVMSM